MEFHSVVLERASGLWQHHQLALGIRGIDAQHAWLVALVLELEWVLNRETADDDERIQTIINHARNYAAEHFAIEEELFQRLHYSDGANHIRSHRNFVKTVERLFAETRTREGVHKLYRLLRLWLVHHIQTEDRGYADYFKKRKLMEQANAFFEELNEERPVLDESRLRLLEIVSGGDRDVEVTTPEILQEIASLWRRLNLQIGVPLVDIQHLWLIKMVVGMDAAMGASQLTRDAVLAQTINEAVAYIDVHFRTEEELMRVIGYDHIGQHSNTHRKFEEFVRQRRADLVSGNRRAAMTLVNDLRSWLTNHIAIEDKKLAQFYRDNKAAALAFSKESILSGRAKVRKNQLNLYTKIVKEGG